MQCRLFEDGAYSDCVVICGDDKYNLHKAILCTQSSFFAAAFRHDFKVRLSVAIRLFPFIRILTASCPRIQEKESGTVHLPNDDPAGVKCMLQYLYQRDYKVELPASKPKSTESANAKEAANTKDAVKLEVVCQHCERPHEAGSKRCGWCGADRGRLPGPTHLQHVSVYTLAHKYNVDGLKALSANRFEDVANVLWNHANFIEAVKLAYTEIPDKKDALKDAIVKILVTRPKLLKNPTIKGVLEETSLAFDVLMRFSDRGTLGA